MPLEFGSIYYYKYWVIFWFNYCVGSSRFDGKSYLFENRCCGGNKCGLLKRRIYTERLYISIIVFGRSFIFKDDWS
ncbi:hypothetical protein A4A49_52792 [Nicotiana attenuata]|uniref:Uncharacterized protein n=1 Tax=Nicotiana attenuata TaxID=49451 RepID=A0A314KNP8_NICAT|nr:hypothetical protein A4A49_52792 [Nicotiana attenuata]